MAEITTFGRTDIAESKSPATVRSASSLRGRSSAELNVKHAKVTRDGRFYLVEFADGQMTQGRNRAEVLVMAADLLACCDERSPSHYWARWAGEDAVEVLVA